jgi:hypothetical protein
VVSGLSLYVSSGPENYVSCYNEDVAVRVRGRSASFSDFDIEVSSFLYARICNAYLENTQYLREAGIIHRDATLLYCKLSLDV